MTKRNQQGDLFSSEYSLKTLNVKVSKNKKYSKINAKIRKLQVEKEKLEVLKARILDVNKEYAERITPLKDELHKLDEETLSLFEKFRNKKTVGKKYKELALREMSKIISRLSEGGYMSPYISDLETEIREKEGENLTEEEEEEMKGMFKQMLDDMFQESGISPDISFDEFKNMSMQEVIERMQQKIFEEKEKMQEEMKHEFNKEKQSYNDETFKVMYKSLAKLLHPDKKGDNNSIENKEQLMKDLSLAWENRDYLKLLEINLLVNPNSEGVALDNKHLKEIERSITQELEKIEEFKYAVKNEVTDEFIKYNEFFHVLKSKREAKFLVFEQEFKETIINNRNFNKENFKSIKKTREYLDESVYDFDDVSEFLDMLLEDFDFD